MLSKYLTLSTSDFIIYLLLSTTTFLARWMHCTKLCSHFQRSLTSVSIYGLRGDLMDYKTFSCEEPRCAPGECQLLRPAEKQREGWLYGNFLFSGSGNPFWNFLPGWPTLGNGHVLQLECCCNYTHGLRHVSPPTSFSALLTHQAKISTPHNQSPAALSWLQRTESW